MDAGRICGVLGRGLFAGLIGTVAMTVSSTVEEKVRGREPSTAPADAAAVVLGIGEFSSDSAKARFGNAVHWTYGTSWGVVRALLGELLPPAAAGGAHFAVVWGSEQAMLPALGVAPPLTEWGATEVAIDAFHHVVYAAAASVSYELLAPRA